MLRPRFPPLRLGVPHRGIKTPPPPSYELNRQGWLRMDPVMKWTLLVDLGRRVPLLLKKSVEENTGVLPDNPKMPPPVFSSSNVTQHASLVKELPYSVRLKLALSCLLWVRCLRDVQETLARLRLPYTHISRFGDAPIATVYPTRWQEYWVDINSMVQIKMDTELNDTAEQVPAPHTWDPETAVTMEDAETESTIALEYSVPHGQKGRRGQSQQLLDRVQGTVSRASEDDELANKLLAHGKRRRLLTQGSGLTKYTGELRTMGSSERQKGWAVKDALRKVDPPTFEQDSRADAEYHGNQHRGEGCPVTERGLAPSTPIHIRVEEATPAREQLLRYCVMAHSAILSSLFTEGRTVRFSSNHPLVVDYVKWLFYEMEKHKFLSVSLVTTESEDTVRSYFPSWVWKTGAVVLLPPAGETYTTHEVRQLASLIVRSAPCSVLVEASLQANSYVKPIESEVTRLLDSFGLASDSVSYVPVGRKAHTSTTEKDTKGKDTAEQKNRFVPRRNEACSARHSMWSRLLTVVGDRWWKGKPVTRSWEDYIREVCAVCVLFYGVQVLYTPTNCALKPRHLKALLWKDLPPNVRLVGVNTSPLDILYFYPQAVFLTQKVGNAYRYRAVDRSVVSKCCEDSLLRHPIRYWSTRVSPYYKTVDRIGLHSSLGNADRATIKLGKAGDAEGSTDALVMERSVDYLAEPNRVHLLSIMMAKLFKI